MYEDYEVNRRRPWLPLAASALLVILLAGLVWWWFGGRALEYQLAVGNARGLQTGDAVVMNGVRVGQVVRVSSSDDGALVRLRMDRSEPLRNGDLLRVHRGLLAATSEVRVTRPCRPGGETGEAAPPIPRSWVLDEARLPVVVAIRARCSEIGRRIGARLEEVTLDDAVATMREALGEARAWSEEAIPEGKEFLREQGARLIERLEDAGLFEKADSIRRMMDDEDVVRGR